MPTTTPDLKIDAVRNFGAEVVLYGDSLMSHMTMLSNYQRRRD